MNERRRKDRNGIEIAGSVDLHFRFGSEMKRWLSNRRRNLHKRQAFRDCERRREGGSQIKAGMEWEFEDGRERPLVWFGVVFIILVGLNRKWAGSGDTVLFHQKKRDTVLLSKFKLGRISDFIFHVFNNYPDLG